MVNGKMRKIWIKTIEHEMVRVYEKKIEKVSVGKN